MQPARDQDAAAPASGVLTGAPLMVRDPAGRIRLWSPVLAVLYGYSAEEAEGRNADELLATEYPFPAAEIEAAFEAHGRWSGELVRRRRDGAKVAVTAEWLRLPGEGGGADAVIETSREAVAGEGLAEQDHWRLASIVENSEDAIIAKTLDGVVTSWNRAAEAMFGYAAEDMVGQPIARLFPQHLLDEEAAILEQVRRGEPISHYETVRLRKDGTEIHVSLSVSPIRDASGRVIGASKIVRDLSERKRIEERYDELQSELFHVSRLNDMGQMASAFAHELNQPLTAISSYLSGVKKLIERGETAQAAEGCERAAKQVARAGEVIRSLRDFVRKGKRVRQVENLAAVVEESGRLALVGARSDGVKVSFSLAADAPEALMDKVQVQQVVVNLVRNAIEAMAESARRELTVSTRVVDGESVEVAVADSGPGLAEEIRARLFQPFATTKEAGMGVGLSLCRTIIEDHGGQIWAEDAPGGGTVFRFTLPSVFR